MEVNTKFSRIVGIVLLLGGAFEAARIGWADWSWREATKRGFEAAIRADPNNAEYHAALGRFADAVRLSPLDADYHIRRGLELESAGDVLGAERELLQAARLSRKYDPRWTLANFYFRQQRLDDFWKWTREALPISYGDRSPLFDLAWSASDDSARILALIPDDAALRRHYLDYLVARQRWKAAAELVRTGTVSREGTPFDWTALPSKGIVARGKGAAWRVEFDGTQPEQCEILARIEPVEPGTTLTLRWKYSESLTTPDHAVSSPSLHWRIADFGSTQTRAAGEMQWTAPPGSFAARIWLTYEKPAGSMRAEGSLEIEKLELEHRP